MTHPRRIQILIEADRAAARGDMAEYQRLREQQLEQAAGPPPGESFAEQLLAGVEREGATLDSLEARLARLDARKVRQAPGQLGLDLTAGPGTGEPCGESFIAREKVCRKGEAAQATTRRRDPDAVLPRQLVKALKPEVTPWQRHEEGPMRGSERHNRRGDPDGFDFWLNHEAEMAMEEAEQQNLLQALEADGWKVFRYHRPTFSNSTARAERQIEKAGQRAIQHDQLVFAPGSVRLLRGTNFHSAAMPYLARDVEKVGELEGSGTRREFFRAKGTDKFMARTRHGKHQHVVELEGKEAVQQAWEAAQRDRQERYEFGSLVEVTKIPGLKPRTPLRLDALIDRLKGLQERFDARRIKQAPGQLGLDLGGGGPGTGEPCGESFIAREKVCRKGLGQEEPPQEAAAAEEVDFSDPQQQQAFQKQLEASTLASPRASLDGGDVAKIMATLGSLPGRQGQNARRMAKFVEQQGLAFYIDRQADPDRYKGWWKDRQKRDRILPELGHLISDKALDVARKMMEASGDRAVYEDVMSARGHLQKLSEITGDDEQSQEQARTYEELFNERLVMLETACRTSPYTLGSTRKGWGQVMVWDAGRPSRTGAGDSETAPYNASRGVLIEPLLRSVRRSLRMSKGAGRDENKLDALVGKGSPSSPVAWNESIARTVLHEIGHQVQYRALTPMGQKVDVFPVRPGVPEGVMLESDPIDGHLIMKGDNALVSRYAAINTKELFAETFVAYVIAPDDLEQFNPALYRWVDDSMKTALKRSR